MGKRRGTLGRNRVHRVTLNNFAAHDRQRSDTTQDDGYAPGMQM